MNFIKLTEVGRGEKRINMSHVYVIADDVTSKSGGSFLYFNYDGSEYMYVNETPEQIDALMKGNPITPEVKHTIGPWIEHTGNVMPVSERTYIRVITQYGHTGGGYADAFLWGDNCGGDRVMRYAVYKIGE